MLEHLESELARGRRRLRGGNDVGGARGGAGLRARTQGAVQPAAAWPGVARGRRQRRTVGARVNAVRAALTDSLEARRAEFREACGLDAPGGRPDRPVPARAPTPHAARCTRSPWSNASARGLRQPRLPRRAGARDRGRLAQLPGAQHPRRPSRPHDEGLAVRRDPGHPELLLRTETSRRSRSARCSRSHRPCTSSRRAASTGGDVRRDAPAGVPPGRRARRGRGDHVRRPQGDARGDRQGAVRSGSTCAARPGVSSRSSSPARRSA